MLTPRNILIMLKNLQQMHLKQLRKEQFKKQQKQQVIWLIINFWKVRKVSKPSPQDSSETVESETENTGFGYRNTKRKIYISRKKTKIYWWCKINIIV